MIPCFPISKSITENSSHGLWTTALSRIRPARFMLYSNFGYCLLGRVIEKLTAQKYSAHVQRTIFSLCGITDMQIAGNTLRERATTEVTYYKRGWGNPYGMNVAREDSNGGWIG